MTREEFLKDFQKKLFEKFPNGYQSWWPNFIFHYSDITNIHSILNSGKLYCRHKVEELDLMQNDNASDDVISNTFENYKDYVRCYFGAKTPTQYQNEGIKPINQIYNNAHCPVPVFLLFDFVKLLSQKGVLFSSGNIAASGADIYSAISDLDKLEFEYIYHRGSLFQATNPSHIKYCRHAEVLISNELDVFEFLKFICVRSEAEKETLLYGLNDSIIEQLKGKIKVFNKDGIFENDRFFVESVKLIDNEIKIIFANAGKYEFKLDIEAKNLITGKESKASKEYIIPKSINLKKPTNGSLKKLYLRIDIDGNLVYENNIVSEEESIL